MSRRSPVEQVLSTSDEDTLHAGSVKRETGGNEWSDCIGVHGGNGNKAAQTEVNVESPVVVVGTIGVRRPNDGCYVTAFISTRATQLIQSTLVSRGLVLRLSAN